MIGSGDELGVSAERKPRMECAGVRYAGNAG
jgi:hypothetical protein